MRFWSVKNIVLVMMSLLCLFLLLQAMGAFNYKAGDFSESYTSQAARRVRAAGDAATWKIAITAPLGSPIGRDALAGAAQMVEDINKKGGVLGKSLELLHRDSSADALENKFVIQQVCEETDIAFLIGPWYSSETLSIRGLTQFQALPALSITLGEDLPALEPDTFVSVLPPLSRMTGPIIEELKSRGCKRVLLISPDKKHYGGRFASRLERDMDSSHFFEELFRADYTPEAEFGELFRILKLYHENSAPDAILFTGDAKALPILGQAMRAVNIQTPVFGSDLLDLPGIRQIHGGDFPADLTYPRLKLSTACWWDDEAEVEAKDNSGFSLWRGYGMLCVALIREALKRKGGYEPGAVAAAMREALRTGFQTENSMIKVELVHLSATGQEGRAR